MDNCAIDIQGLGKRYRIGRAVTRAANAREAVQRAVLAPFKYLSTRVSSAEEDEILWALKDVTFSVQQGEVVGIIGRNGAGKSTLLKILSKITDPTNGQAIIRGRVNSLLEVGTGFHPELTGRENIYLNAAMHGMKRVEIDRSLDEIIGFSGIEKFIDTPVKRYSSGMYTRLAFAVAAHLDPDVLIVDEVLAVGDAQFQARCIEKMGAVASEGRTVLFVSHNMQAITSLCTRCVLVEGGCIVKDGSPQEVVAAYLESRIEYHAFKEWQGEDAPGNGMVRLRSIRVLSHDGRISYDHSLKAPVTLEMECEINDSPQRVHAGLHVYNRQNICLFAVTNHNDASWREIRSTPGCYRLRCTIPGNFLNDGRHHVHAFLVRDLTEIIVKEEGVVSFIVHDYGESRGGYVQQWVGAVRPQLPWEAERIREDH